MKTQGMWLAYKKKNFLDSQDGSSEEEEGGRERAWGGSPGHVLACQLGSGREISSSKAGDFFFWRKTHTLKDCPAPHLSNCNPQTFKPFVT